MELSKADVERITENVLRGLTLKIEDGGFTDPNSRSIILKLGTRELSRVYFDVVQQEEYGG